MKKICFFVILILCSYWGYLRQQEVRDFLGKAVRAVKLSFSGPEEKPSALAEIASNPAPIPELKPMMEASVAAIPPPATSKASDLPEDVYYTADRVTFATEA